MKRTSLPFDLTIRNGIPIYEQLISVMKKCIANGTLQGGDKVPSIREVSKELSINPNTVQKAMSALVHQGHLEVRPGIGLIVSTTRVASFSEVEALLSEKVDSLIIEGMSLGCTLGKLSALINKRWNKLTQ